MNIRYTIGDCDRDEVNIKVEYSTNGSEFRTCSRLGDYGDSIDDLASSDPKNPAHYRFVWDSRKDLPGYSGKVSARLIPRDDIHVGKSASTGEFDLDNSVRRSRVVLAARNKDSSIGVLVLAPDGTLSDTGIKVKLSDAPSKIVFSPDGMHALVLHEQGGGHETVHSMLSIDHDMHVKLDYEWDAAGMYIVDAVFTPDGARLYAADGNHESNGGGLHMFECDDDGKLTPTDWFVSLHTPNAVAVHSTKSGLVLASGGITEQDGFDLSLVDARTKDVVGVDLNTGLSSPRIALDSLRDIALITDDGSYSGNKGAVASALLEPDGTGLDAAGFLTPVQSATDVHLVPGTTLAVASNYFGDGVYVVDIGDKGELTLVRTLKGIGLAGFMDVVDLGEGRSLALVPAISPKEGVGTLIARILFVQGGDTQLLEPFSIGTGVENMLSAIAIQP
ncbi:MAG: hypothetical protein GXP49_15220 [Deltaproteobacteria bacterium]|nr:hypothetical protein [Deltaproteobacteria bacterium]